MFSSFLMKKCACLLINWQCSPVDGEVVCAIYIGQQFFPRWRESMCAITYTAFFPPWWESMYAVIYTAFFPVEGKVCTLLFTLVFFSPRWWESMYAVIDTAFFPRWWESVYAVIYTAFFPRWWESVCAVVYSVVFPPLMGKCAAVVYMAVFHTRHCSPIDGKVCSSCFLAVFPPLMGKCVPVSYTAVFPVDGNVGVFWLQVPTRRWLLPPARWPLPHHWWGRGSISAQCHHVPVILCKYPLSKLNHIEGRVLSVPPCYGVGKTRHD